MNNWIPAKAKLSGLVEDSPSVWMDGRGFPYCAWVKDEELNFCRYGGSDWEILGESSSILTSSDIILPKNCLYADSYGNPRIVYLTSTGALKKIYWDGDSWKSDTSVASSGVLDACIFIRRGTEYVVYMRQATSEKLITIVKKVGTTWSLVGETKIPKLDNEDFQLVARYIGRKINIFWSSSLGDSSWIGNVLYDLGSSTWSNIPNQRIESSVTTAEITGLDFVAEDEDFSSSSSSVSTVSSSCS